MMERTHKKGGWGRPLVAEREALAVVVPSLHAEVVRKDLSEAGLLARDLQPMGSAEAVAFPLSDEADVAHVVLQRLSNAPVNAVLEQRQFMERSRGPDSYRDLLPDLPEDVRAQLPSSFDVVGDIAVLKLYPELEPYAAHIGAALLASQKRIRVVALDGGVQGDLRVRALTPIAGHGLLTTTHKEHGLQLQVPLDKVYFSPRLATERFRLAERVLPGERVLDLFAGVGAWVVLVARTREPVHVMAIDLNPDAILALRHNLTAHDIPPGLVDVVEGDARAVAPRDGSYDHVVMNLPHGAVDFLDVAARALAPGGEVHLYAMVEKTEREAFEAMLVSTLTEQLGRPVEIAEVRQVRSYAPTIDGLAFTLADMSPATDQESADAK